MLRMKEHTEIPNYIKLKKGKEIPFEELDSWISDFYTVKNVKHGIKLFNTENILLSITTWYLPCF